MASAPCLPTATDDRNGAGRFVFTTRAVVAALVLALGVVLVALAATSPVLGQSAAPPADDSADAGFARDMSDHHAQAVEMSLIVLGRTDDPAIRTLATDILLTQQAQIGMMHGWLDIWGLPQAGFGPRMAWMGHAMDGSMPGMASDDEMASLRDLPPAEADRQYLELMIRHHQGGLEMARAGIDLGQQPVVRRLAQAILNGQQAEIDAMRQMLDEMAATPAAGA